MQSVSLKKVKKYYARLGFSITKSNGYFCAERKSNQLFIQADRIQLLCQTLNRLA
ncbi:MAG: hypothetical protein KAG34_09660 [Cocleimonas sp.]|nr:hypothetical protein [Cocleimonas sp.]